LDLAARSISADPAVGAHVQIDSDTQGVLGHIPVTDTILQKIDACHAFVRPLSPLRKLPSLCRIRM
jgi:hypothetical protein